MNDPVGDIVLFIVQQLRAFQRGEEHALEDLADTLLSGDCEPGVVQSAFQFILQVLEPYCSGMYVEKGQHRKVNNRILDTAEESLISREAYGHLLHLRDRGDLDDLQLEMVLNQVVGTQLEPVTVEELKRIISHVLFTSPDGDTHGMLPPGTEDDLPRPH